MSFLFRGQSRLHLQEYLRKRRLLNLTLGTTEEHGPHKPVDTDSRIAGA
jgi:creatinine amidohydrolase/Fe(II)-dependent formamide hydrolase-like protein